jgi:hypothetical protein
MRAAEGAAGAASAAAEEAARREAAAVGAAAALRAELSGARGALAASEEARKREVERLKGEERKRVLESQLEELGQRGSAAPVDTGDVGYTTYQ